MNKKLEMITVVLLLRFNHDISFSQTEKTSDMQKHSTATRLLNEIVASESPGVQYMIVSPESTIFEYHGGLSDIKNNIPVNARTTFNGFSVTKTFTALAILQLEEQGKLKTTDSIAQYLDFYPYKSNVTIQQVLSHTSGLPNPIPLKWIHLLSEHESFSYEKFIQKVIEENNELGNEPGKKYAYSNIGYLLLGEVIRRVSGESYQEYMKKNILEKLRFDNGAYLGFEISGSVTQAYGYIKKWSLLNFALNFMIDKDKYIEGTYEGWSQFKYYYVNGYSYGGLIGNARGFAQYLQALLKDNDLIGSKSKLKLFEAQKTINGKEIEMCLSWFKGKLGNEVYYAHAGGGGGYYCEIRLYPDKKLASVIMFNRTGVSNERILDKIDNIFLKK